MLESTRAKEEAVKRETTEQLDIFRRQQEEADKAILSEAVDMKDTSPATKILPSESQWAINARKRKRIKGREGLKSAKVRKTSSANEESPPELTTVEDDESAIKSVQTGEMAVAQYKTPVNAQDVVKGPVKGDNAVIMPSSKEENPTTIGLGLTGYSSDEEN